MYKPEPYVIYKQTALPMYPSIIRYVSSEPIFIIMRDNSNYDKNEYTVNSLINALGAMDESRLWGTFPPSRGFLRNKNRTIISRDMGKNVKSDTERATKSKGVPFLRGGAITGEFTVLIY